MNRLLIAAIAIIAAASFSALGMSIVNASNSNQEKIGNVPGVIAYQGYLADDRDLPLKDGNHNLEFAIYENATTSRAIWNEKQTVVTSNGVFSAMLGSNTALSEDLFTSSIDLHLGISVDSGNEALPRQRLASVPFAIIASKAKNATTAQRALELDCTGCVTDAHLAADAKSTGGTSGTTLTSPDGRYTVRVTNNGIFLEGPDSGHTFSLVDDRLVMGGNDANFTVIGDTTEVTGYSVVVSGQHELIAQSDDGNIELTAKGDIRSDADGDIRADARQVVRLDSGLQMGLNAGTNLDIDATFNLTLEGTTATLGGAITKIGGTANCKAAAGLGDLVVVLPNTGIGTVNGGSPTVFICS